MLGGGQNYWTKQCGDGRFDFWSDYEPYWDNTTHTTDLLNMEAGRVIQSHLSSPASSPFFLFLSHLAPHDPLLPTVRHEEVCRHITNPARRRSCGLVAGVDEGLANITDILRQAGVLEDTVILYSHDNGGVPYAGARNYPFRGGKATAYEGGVRSPGFIHAPKLLKPDTDFSGLFHVSDYFPTLVSIINKISGEEHNITVVDPEDLDGVDQLEGLLHNKTVRDHVHIHRDFALDTHVYRRGQWKLIVGNHIIPFIFPLVYNETDGWWAVDQGSLRGRVMEVFLWMMDVVVGNKLSESLLVSTDKLFRRGKLFVFQIFTLVPDQLSHYRGHGELSLP